MPIEHDPKSGVVTITGDEPIFFFALLQARGRLRLEINHPGMKFRQSTLAAVNRRFGTTFRRKQQALDFLDSLIQEIKDNSRA